MADDSPAPKSYRVIAPTTVLDHAHGATFEAVIDPVQEKRLLEGGAIALSGTPAARLPEDEDATRETVEPTPAPAEEPAPEAVIDPKPFKKQPPVK